jgi:hypothetical protein
LRRFFIIASGNKQFSYNNHLNISKILKPVLFAIQPVNTVFDLAGMIFACLPDASALPAAVSGRALISALSVTARGHIPEAVPVGVRRGHGGIGNIGNLIRQPHPL